MNPTPSQSPLADHENGERVSKCLDVTQFLSSPAVRQRGINVIQRFFGAYRVRYLFVICGFSLADTETVEGRFHLGRAPEREHLEPFRHWLGNAGPNRQFSSFLQVTDPSFDTLLTSAHVRER